MPEASKADAALAVMDQAVVFAATRWLEFTRTLPFKESVPLADRIGAFFVPFEQGLRSTFPALSEAPANLLLVITSMGIEQAGTHSRQAIEQELGTRLPL